MLFDSLFKFRTLSISICKLWNNNDIWLLFWMRSYPCLNKNILQFYRCLMPFLDFLFLIFSTNRLLINAQLLYFVFLLFLRFKTKDFFKTISTCLFLLWFGVSLYWISLQPLRLFFNLWKQFFRRRLDILFIFFFENWF